MYKLTYESKDGHKYQISVNATSEIDARLKAEDQIQKNGWEHYQYKLLFVDKL